MAYVCRPHLIVIYTLITIIYYHICFNHLQTTERYIVHTSMCEEDYVDDLSIMWMIYRPLIFMQKRLPDDISSLTWLDAAHSLVFGLTLSIGGFFKKDLNV